MSAVEWNNELIYKLIDLYRERRLLWDTNLKENKDKKRKVAAWEEIGHTLNIDREEARRKMKILITQYQREYAKINQQPGEDGGYTSKWFAYNNLSFLKSKTAHSPHPTPAEHAPSPPASLCVIPHGNMQVLDESSVEVKEELEDDQFNDEIYEPKVSHRKRSIQICESDVSSPRKTQSRVAQIMCAAPTMTSTSTSGATATASTSGATSERDEYSVFGEYVALKLRKIGDAYSRHKALQKIHDILFSAEMGEFTPPP